MTKQELQKKHDLLIEGLKRLTVYNPRAYGNNSIALDIHTPPRFGRDDNYDKKVVKHSDMQMVLNNCN